jgi:hypothetical protein
LLFLYFVYFSQTKVKIWLQVPICLFFVYNCNVNWIINDEFFFFVFNTFKKKKQVTVFVCFSFIAFVLCFLLPKVHVCFLNVLYFITWQDQVLS